MIKKITHPTDKKELMRLSCDKCRASAASEHFPRSMDVVAIAKWAREHGWGVSRNDAGRYENWCPHCEDLRRAPSGYWDRIRA